MKTNGLSLHWRLALTGLMVFGAQAASAQTGGLSGSVTDRASGIPISAARIQIVGMQNAAANTDDAGRYLIRNIPAGAHTVRVTRIGYRPETGQATIAANDTTTLNFQIAQSAVELQQVVVTGTGGAVEKRKVGASIGSLDVTQQQEVMPVTNFTSASLFSSFGGVPLPVKVRRAQVAFTCAIERPVAF